MQATDPDCNPSCPIALMYQSQMCRYSAATEPSTVCSVMVRGSAVASTLHKSSRWFFAPIAIFFWAVKPSQQTQ